MEKIPIKKNKNKQALDNVGPIDKIIAQVTYMNTKRCVNFCPKLTIKTAE